MNAKPFPEGGPRRSYLRPLAALGLSLGLLLADPLLATPGDLDPLDAALVGAEVFTAVTQADGKILLGGNFQSVLGVPRRNLARLHADGTLDSTFDPSPDGPVSALAVQDDGRIVAAGGFQSVRPNGGSTVARGRLARFQADGTLDVGFHPNADGPVGVLLLEPTGSMLVCGNFTSFQPSGGPIVNRRYVARVTAGGGLATLNPHPDNSVFALARRPDGRILLGGRFRTLQPGGTGPVFERSGLAELETDNSPSAFRAGASADVFCLVPGADGSILAGGNFSVVYASGSSTPVARRCLARFQVDGSVDPAFDPSPDGAVTSLVRQADGKIVAAGLFSALQPNGGVEVARTSVARLLPGGAVDVGFELRPAGFVRGVSLQADGRALPSGYFTELQTNESTAPVPRRLFARLLSDGALQTLTAPSPAQVRWNRGGTAPEVARVEFDLSTDGGVNWTVLGSATRVGTSPNWELNGLSLPPGGQLRARGQAQGATNNGSSGIIAQISAFPSAPQPEIALEQPAGVDRHDGFSVLQLGTAPVGGNAGPRSFVVRNQGEAPLALGALTIDGAHPGDFVLDTTGMAGTLAPGASTTFTVTFTPAAPGPRTAALHLASNDASENPFDLTLVGNPEPEISVESPAGVVRSDGGSAGSFGSVPIGGSLGRLFRIRNLGAGTLSVGGISLDGAHAADYTIDTTGTATSLAGGAFTSFLVRFTPSATGPRTAAVHIVNGDADENPFDLTLTGSGLLAPDIAVEQPAGIDQPAGSNVSFGNAYVQTSTPVTRTFTVRNSGAQDLEIFALYADGNHPGDFQVNQDKTETLLAPGASTTFTVTFQPQEAGARDAVLIIECNDPDESAFSLSLTGAATIQPGSLDPLDGDLSGGDRVTTALVQPDGKIIIGGTFTSVQGVPRNNLARLHPNGSLDLGFDPKPNNEVYCLALQPDGKILVGGFFTAFAPNGGGSTSRLRLARLNADGTLDAAFDPRVTRPSFCSVNSLVLQPDGGIVVGGTFTALQPPGLPAPITRNNLARLLADGTLDPGFDPNCNGPVYAATLQPDGRLLVGGVFTQLSPNGGTSVARNNAARLNADGTVEPAFDPNANGTLRAILAQPDGRVLIAGFFNTVQPPGAPAPIQRSALARFHPDGTLDTAFDPAPNNLILTLGLQTDGRILVGGAFDFFQPNGAPTPTISSRAARLERDGTVDSTFRPSPDNLVFTISQQADGKILLGGTFTTLQPNGAPAPEPRVFFARVENDPATQSLAVPVASIVQWQRGGASAEVGDVTFELSTNGGASWTPLGPGSRVGFGPDWVRTGLSLPASGLLRARGRTSDASASNGLLEQVVAFPAAEIALEQEGTGALQDGTSTVYFDRVALGSASPPVSITVRNTGAAPLGLGTLTLDGANAAEFLVDTSALPATLAPGTAATFTVTFVPTALGLRTAAFHLPCTDGDENPFDVALSGGLTPYERWIDGWYGTPDITGLRAPLADPNGNQRSNLLEYALVGNPRDIVTNQGNLQQVGVSADNRLQLRFQRGLERTDLTLTVSGSDSLTGPWTPLARSVGAGVFGIFDPAVSVLETGVGLTRTVTITDPFVRNDPAHPRRFLRLEVDR